MIFADFSDKNLASLLPRTEEKRRKSIRKERNTEQRSDMSVLALDRKQRTEQIQEQDRAGGHPATTVVVVAHRCSTANMPVTVDCNGL